MSEKDPTKTASSAWSEDMLWASNAFGSAVILIDRTGALHANAAAQALAGRARRELHRDDQAAGAAAGPAEPAILLDLLPAHAWDSARADGRWVGEVVVPGSTLVLEIAAHQDEHEGVNRRYVVFYDVSARRARELELQQRHDELQRTHRRLAGAQEQLLQSEKMASIGVLAAGVAHEINNPIGYVHSNLGTLQEYVGALIALIDCYSEALQDDEPAGHREKLKAMRERLDVDFILGDLPQLLSESREGIERVTRIVQDLKEFSHVGRDEPMRPSNLEKGLESTLNIVWNDLKYKVRLEKHYGELPLVECHPSEINQVFMNLLINAGQAIVGRGVIVLASGVEDDEVWISVGDSGCGIPEEAMQRIFDPFYTTKPIGRGTGLGLAICYSIVAKHHGRIEVSSRVGVGSTFRVVLPITQPAAAVGQAGEQPGF